MVGTLVGGLVAIVIMGLFNEDRVLLLVVCLLGLLIVFLR